MVSPQTVPADVLGRYHPVTKLPLDQIEELASTTTVERLEAGCCLFREGDTDNEDIFLLRGEVVLSSASEGERVISSASADALRPLVNQQPRQFTAITKTVVVCVRVDRDLLNSMIVWGQFAMPEPEVIMSEEGIFTIDKGSWLKKMVKSPTFKNLPPANIEQLLDKLEPHPVSAGKIIIRQGDQGDYFYMIDSGSALVTRQTEDEEEESIELAELKEGTSFGEAALISDTPRNATVSMMSDGMLLRLSKDDFLTLLRAPHIQWISYEDAQARQLGSYQWLDIRLPSEYAEGHIPGALNIPLQQLHRRARDLDKTIDYICYCDSGSRSSAAQFILKQYGLEGFVLRNGIEGLANGLLQASRH